MKRRLYYLLPDPGSARAITNDLLLARIEERHIHFVARPGTPMDGLHEASPLQTTDVVHGAQRGALLGAALGALTGYLSVRYAFEAPAWQVAGVVGGGGVGTLIGGWTASMAGAAVPNSRHRAFEAEIAQGRILLIVDVPEHRVADVQALVGRTHPEAVDRGLEANIPAFP